MSFEDNLAIVRNSKGKGVTSKKSFKTGDVLYSFMPDFLEFDIEWYRNNNKDYYTPGKMLGGPPLGEPPNVRELKALEGLEEIEGFEDFAGLSGATIQEPIHERIINQIVAEFNCDELFDLNNHYRQFEKNPQPWVQDFATRLTLTYPDQSVTFYKKVIYTFLINQFCSMNSEREYNGIALDLKFSLINHSCYPNTTMIYNSNYELLATRNISIGEEITITYIFPNVPSMLRQLELKDRYFFNCTCKGCKSDYHFSFECHQCHMKIRSLTFDDIVTASNSICVSCNTCIDPDVLKVFRNIVDEYLKFYGLDIQQPSAKIMRQLVKFDLTAFVPEEMYSMWNKCCFVISSQSVPIYCFPINMIIPKIKFDTFPRFPGRPIPITQLQLDLNVNHRIKQLFYVTFGMVQNEIDLAYNLRLFVKESLSLFQDHHTDLLFDVIAILPIFVRLIEGFFNKHNQDIYAEVQSWNFHQVYKFTLLKQLMNKFHMVFKFQNDKFLIKSVTGFLDIYNIDKEVAKEEFNT